MNNKRSSAMTSITRYDGQKSFLLTDQKKAILGTHHPWRRFFARTVDTCTCGLISFMIVTSVYKSQGHRAHSDIELAMTNPIIAGIMLYIAWAICEAIILSLSGTTPAKWLFGIKVLRSDGGYLSLSESLERSLGVATKGMGLGIPFLTLATQLYCYFKLTKTGSTSWDSAAKSEVIHAKWSGFRATICVIFTIFSLFVVAIITNGN